jgi:hypothetical protein
MSALVGNSDSVSHNVQLAIYTLTGSTYNLIAKTSSINVPANTAKSWVTGNLTTSANLSASATYFLAVNSDSSTLKLYCDAQAGGAMFVVYQTYGAWSSAFSSPVVNWYSQQLDILVNYAGSNPMLGYKAVGTNYVNGTFNNVYFCTPGFNGVNTTGVSMSALVGNSDSVSHNVQLSIYTLTGSTFSLVAKTGSINVPANSAQAWVTGNLTASVSLSASTTYYLTVNTDSGSVKLYCDAQAGGAMYVVYQTYGNWSTSFNSPIVNWYSQQLGIRVN